MAAMRARRRFGTAVGGDALSVLVCCMKQKSSGFRCIVMAASIPGVENMTRASPKCNPASERGVRLEYALRTTGSASVVLFLLLSPTLVWPQASVPDQPSGPAHEQQTQPSGSTGDSATQPDAATQSQFQAAVLAPEPVRTLAGLKKDNSAGKQTPRILWVVPNFTAVSADTVLPPLTVGEKFVLATKDSVDYSSFVWAGILAGQSMALNSSPELHHGIAGYGRYYWRAFADQASGAYFTEAILPALTHEDPRYYTRGHGGFFRRVGYALSRVVVTPTDSGGTTFNFSEVLGNGMEAGLANLYYPRPERTLRKTAENWGAQMESAALNNLVKEFWPDIRRKVLRQK